MLCGLEAQCWLPPRSSFRSATPRRTMKSMALASAATTLSSESCLSVCRGHRSIVPYWGASVLRNPEKSAFLYITASGVGVRAVCVQRPVHEAPCRVLSVQAIYLCADCCMPVPSSLTPHFLLPPFSLLLATRASSWQMQFWRDSDATGKIVRGENTLEDVWNLSPPGNDGGCKPFSSQPIFVNKML